MTTNYTFDEIISKFNVKCDKNTDKDLFVSIINGNFDKEINEDMDPNIMFNIGTYYQFIKKDYDLMKKYYLMAINNDNINAMFNLDLIS